MSCTIIERHYLNNTCHVFMTAIPKPLIVIGNREFMFPVEIPKKLNNNNKKTYLKQAYFSLILLSRCEHTNHLFLLGIPGCVCSTICTKIRGNTLSKILIYCLFIMLQSNNFMFYSSIRICFMNVTLMYKKVQIKLIIKNSNFKAVNLNLIFF